MKTGILAASPPIAETYLDPYTGLMWLTDGNRAGKEMEYSAAGQWARSIAICGFSDWRLPTESELSSFAQRGPHPSAWFNANGFANVQAGVYWAGGVGTKYGHWGVELLAGGRRSYWSSEKHFVWPVRRGIPPQVSPAEVCSDPKTGLMWATNGNIADSLVTLSAAKERMKYLTYGGFSDWRLPTLDELVSLAKLRGDNSAEWYSYHGFKKVGWRYWSSSTREKRASIWVVDLSNGEVVSVRADSHFGVLPVREVTSPVPAIDEAQAEAILPHLVQGSLGEMGTVCSVGETGLMWARNCNIPGWGMLWEDAMQWTAALDLGGYRDWRLPTKEELGAVTDQGGYSPPYWLLENGFSNVQPLDYWSSSTEETETNSAWCVRMHQGIMGRKAKSGYGYVWPVRST